jgi:alpha-1,2-mannosyltransferase
MVPMGVFKAHALRGHLDLSWQLLLGEPLYQTSPPFGVWWPPFALVVLTPFTVLEHLVDGLGRSAFALTTMMLVAWSLTRLPVSTWRSATLAVAAVAGAMQRNFENLNLNPLLLALVVTGAIALERDDERAAGLWFGAAAALKMFPALLLAYLAARGRWRGAAWGAALGLALTALPLARYGWPDATTAVTAWLDVARAGAWDVLGANQSLAALVVRLGGGRVAWWIATLGLVTVCAVSWSRPRGASPEVFLVILLAILLSPISWPDAFLLAIPAWALVIAAPPPPVARRLWIGALALAALGTSGVLTGVSRPVRLAAFEMSLFTWGTLLLMLLYLVAFPPRDATRRVGTPFPAS